MSYRPARPSRRLVALTAVGAAATMALTVSAPSAVAGRPSAPAAPVASDRGQAGAAGSPRYQIPGVDTPVDTSRATRAAARAFQAYFTDKSRPSVDGVMSHFRREPLAYGDATLGVIFDWPGLRQVFASVMPLWERNGAKSYPLRIVGDDTSAVVQFVDTAGSFGPNEIRVTGVVNFSHGKIVRWVDYWDGRYVGLDVLAGLRTTPVSQFPTDWKESIAGQTADGRVRTVAARLDRALGRGDADDLTRLFAPDATFEDVTAHVTLAGPLTIGRYLHRATGLLPYTGPGTRVSHVVGSRQGGAYEWTAGGDVPRGVTVLELDRQGRISRLTAVWDGSLVGTDRLAALSRLAIES